MITASGAGSSSDVGCEGKFLSLSTERSTCGWMKRQVTVSAEGQ